jgi:hypothetical protein
VTSPLVLRLKGSLVVPKADSPREADTSVGIRLASAKRHEISHESPENKSQQKKKKKKGK